MNNRHALIALINQTGYICYNKKLAKILGLNTAILFAELVNIYDYFNCQEFFLNQSKISDDTTLSKFQIAESSKILVDNGILIITKKGIPCKNWYSLNLEKVLELLENSETSNKETEKQEVKKFDNSKQKNLTAVGEKIRPHLTRTNTRTNTRTEFVVVDDTENSETEQQENVLSEETTTTQEKENRTGTEKNNRFSKPTVEQIKKYCDERKNSVNAQYFFDYYESKGWLVGKTPMKNWQAAVRTWERNEIKGRVKKYSSGSAMSQLEADWTPTEADLNSF